jgi:hypothetical protein
LQKLQNPSNVVFEALCQFRDILIRKQDLDVCGLGRITPNNVYIVLVLECARDFVARHKHWDTTFVSDHPLGKFALSMGV